MRLASSLELLLQIEIFIMGLTFPYFWILFRMVCIRASDFKVEPKSQMYLYWDNYSGSYLEKGVRLSSPSKKGKKLIGGILNRNQMFLFWLKSRVFSRIGSFYLESIKWFFSLDFHILKKGMHSGQKYYFGSETKLSIPTLNV